MDIKTIIEEYGPRLPEIGFKPLPGQSRALSAMIQCGTADCGSMLVECPECQTRERRAHSCGHRFCPQCQNHETTRWIERVKGRLLPVPHYLVTMTVPSEHREAAYQNQRVYLDALFKASSEALAELASNPRHLGGAIGMTGVLHTHSRRLDYHPHVHFLVPAGAFDRARRLWKPKRGKCLLPWKPLTRLFRGKLMALLEESGLKIKAFVKSDWRVHFKKVGGGAKAVEYLGRYLYRGVLSQEAIVANENGKVTFKYVDGKTKELKTRTMPGALFLATLLRHVLPKGFRRARDYGFMNGNASKTLALLLLVLNARAAAPAGVPPRPAFKCPKCGHAMVVVACGLRPSPRRTDRASPSAAGG